MKKQKNKKSTRKKRTFFRKVSFLTRDVSAKNFYTSTLGLAGVLTLGVAILSFSIQETAAQVPDSFKSLPKWRLEQEVSDMTEGYPIATMLPYIFTKDPDTIAYLIGIAKKESNWGKVAPEKDGIDCFNYWGFKGPGSRGRAAGHGCFGSEEEAVEAISGRIDTLINDYNRDTPQEMVVWKCGYSCASHSDASVRKWIRDVAYYSDQVKEARN